MNFLTLVLTSLVILSNKSYGFTLSGNSNSYPSQVRIGARTTTTLPSSSQRTQWQLSPNTQHAHYCTTKTRNLRVTTFNDRNGARSKTGTSLDALPIHAVAASASASASASAASASASLLCASTLKGGAVSVANIMRSLHKDNFYVLSAVMLLSTFGLTLERRTTFGKALSAPLVTMGVGLIIANLGIMPFSSPIYGFVNQNLVALAVPLLLFDSNLRRVVNDTGTLLAAFFVGAISTIIGTLITYPLLPLKALGSDGWKVASALAARHIGGAINFVAVSETLGVSGSAISAAVAADNVVIALYFAMLFTLAKSGEKEVDSGDGDSSNGADVEIDVRDPEDVTNDGDGTGITMPSLAIAMTVACCLVTIGKIMTKAFFPTTSALPLISVATVSAATMFPKFFKELSFTGTAVGVIFMQMFFAASGAAGSIRLVWQKAPSLFLFSALQIAIHFISLIGIGRFIFKLNPNELYLASNACVGGPTTAAAMATAKEWKRLVLPALLIGILGYATATPIALVLGQVLLKLR